MAPPPPGGTAYICGPISHRPDGNRPAFTQAERYLIGQGWATINPLTTRPSLSANALAEAQELGDQYREGVLYRKVMRSCYGDLLTADEVFVLPGWLQSNGASDEVWFATRIGLPVHEFHPDFTGAYRIDPHLAMSIAVVGPAYVG